MTGIRDNTFNVFSDKPAPRPCHTYVALKRIQRDLGMGKLHTGALLCLLEQTGDWQGRTGGNSFRSFLVEEGIEPKAAAQYMRVAQTFVLDLAVPTAQLERICTASMRTLCEAARVANADNIEEVIDIVASLPRPEAIEALQELAPTSDTGTVINTPRSIGKIMDQVSELTLDAKADLYRMLGIGRDIGVRSR
jgi:hypothetical protein